MKRSLVNADVELLANKRKKIPNCSVMEIRRRRGNIPLPDELLSEIIFQFVPLCEWSSSLERVSRQFRRCVFIAYSGVKCVNMKKLFSLKQTIKRWGKPACKLAFSEQRLNSILTKLLSVSPHLTQLVGFQHVIGTVDFATLKILKKFERLQSVCLSRVHIAFQFLDYFVTKLKSLKLLNVSDCCIAHSGFDGSLDVGLLTNISVSFNISKTEGFCVENFCEKLTTLTLNGFERSLMNGYDTEKALQKCTSLESFSIFLHTRNDYAIFLKALRNLPKLISLHVTSDMNKSFGSNFCDWLDSAKNRLQCIEINNVPLSAQVEIFLATQCLKLESLNLSGYSLFSVDALQQLPKLAGNLKNLTFVDRSYPKITCRILLSTLTQLSNLTDLHITRPGYACLNELADICCLENLRNLQLYHWYVTDSLFEYWNEKSETMFERLVTLEISECTNVTDIGACLLAKRAVSLQYFDLHLSRISDATIFTLADFAKNLTHADFVQREPCLIDEKAVLQLMGKAIYLKQLTVNEAVAKKVVQNIDFRPFLEKVEIFTR